MKINLANAIIIIDEAHNIEDSCRSSGSLNLELSDLEIVKMELSALLSKHNQIGFDDEEQRSWIPLGCVGEHKDLDQFTVKLISWMQQKTHIFNKYQSEKKSKM